MTTPNDHPAKPNDSGQMTAAEVIGYAWKYLGELRWTVQKHKPKWADDGDVICRPLYLDLPTPPPEVVARHGAGELEIERLGVATSANATWLRWLAEGVSHKRTATYVIQERLEHVAKHMEVLQAAVNDGYGALSQEAQLPSSADTNEALEMAWHKAHNAWMKANRHGTLAEATEEAVAVLREALVAQFADATAEIERLTKWNWAMAENVKLAETQLAAATARVDDLQQAEAEYRLMHERHGDGAHATRRAWNRLCTVGDAARDWLNKEGGE